MHWVRTSLSRLVVFVTVAVAAGSIAAGVKTPTAPVSPDVPTATNPAVPRPGHVLGQISSTDSSADLRGVAIALVRDGHVVDRTFTNAGGRFAFPNIRPGHFVILAEKRGVGVGRQPGDVKPGETVKVSIELKKPA